MDLELIETLLHYTGGLLAFVTLAFVLYGIWRGTQQRAGRASGRDLPWMRSPWLYLLSAILFCGLGYLGWISLPLAVPPSGRAWMLALGSLLYFPGMALVLWGRLALGRNYFVSTSFGARLYADHRLVTHGSFAIVRHPMYSGLVIAALGSLLLYLTWTALAYALFAPFVLRRARREEQALAAEFGEEWQAYCRRVPAFVPRLWHKKREDGNP